MFFFNQGFLTAQPQEELLTSDTTWLFDGQYEVVNTIEVQKIYPNGIPFGTIYVPPKRVFDEYGTLIAERIYFDNSTRSLYVEYIDQQLVLLHYVVFKDSTRSMELLKKWDGREIIGESYSAFDESLSITYDTTSSRPKIFETRITSLSDSISIPVSFICKEDSTFWIESSTSASNHNDTFLQLRFDENGYPISFGHLVRKYFDVYQSEEEYNNGGPPLSRHKSHEVRCEDWTFFDQGMKTYRDYGPPFFDCN